MEELVGSFERIAWECPQPGIREKRIVIGTKTLRLLEITNRLEHPDWCVKGHVGYVVEGSFVLDIDGKKHALHNSDVFVVKEADPVHRHIPLLESGGRVMLFLVEDSE